MTYAELAPQWKQQTHGLWMADIKAETVLNLLEWIAKRMATYVATIAGVLGVAQESGVVCGRIVDGKKKSIFDKAAQGFVTTGDTEVAVGEDGLLVGVKWFGPVTTRVDISRYVTTLAGVD